jgi:hypothetical protein
MEHVIPMLIGGLIGATVGALIGGFFIRLATHLLLHFRPPFATAFAAALLATLVNAAVGFIVGPATDSMGVPLGWPAYIVLGLLGWVIYAAIVAKLIKHPDTGPITFRDALLISLVAMLFGLILGATLAGMIHLALR